MKNGITDPDTRSDNTHNRREPVHVPEFVLIGFVLLGVLAFVTNFAVTDISGLNIRYTVLLVISSVILIGTVTKQHNYAPLQGSTPLDHDDVAHQTSWTALKPYSSRQSRNCKISRQPCSDQLVLSPVFSFQYTSLLVATTVLASLIKFAVPSDLSLPPNPTITTFICLLCVAVVSYVAWLLRKPVRALVFNKTLGVFWIEKYRVFGWKVGESAQMPIAYIHAIQLLDGSTQEHNSQEKPHGNESGSNFEVNVVFRNAERVNIISHNNGSAIVQDAATLASFLGVPVWNNPPANRTSAS